MVGLYVTLINANLRTIEQVPLPWRADVQLELEKQTK